MACKGRIRQLHELEDLRFHGNENSNLYKEKRKKWNDKIIKFLPEKMVQPEGKIPMKWKDFLNGYKDFPNKELL